MVRGLLVFALFLSPFLSKGQGKIMLVGGGAEDPGGWSDIPYAWAIANSANKKVAVISYGDEDNFIPDYFIALGASDAVNVKIDSRVKADLQDTYDRLMQYDVFFFKGGDQSKYYLFFNDTKTEQAIIAKFDNGGVIAGTSAGMSILSGVIFTAENGSVYPDEALQDFTQSKITLADDFLPLFPGFIFDSHFTERGRGARLMSFMARWFTDKATLLTGLGVDDRTAFCINADNVGDVYGTGSVSIYNASHFSAYQSKRIVSDSVHVTQLLHGHTFDLVNGKILNGPEDFVEPKPSEENGNYQVLLSGSEGLSTNSLFMDALINETGKVTDTVVIVTAPGKARSFKQRLDDRSVKNMLVETSTLSNDDAQIDMRNTIRHSRKILFVENDDMMFFNFLNDGPTGRLISQHIRRNTTVVAFVGEDSRYAGRSFVTNHLTNSLAAYYGTLAFTRGLGLLKTSTIVSNTYDAQSTDFYENTTAAIPYSMVSDSVKYGIYLNRNSYTRFYQVAGKNYFSANGNSTCMVLVNSGTPTTFASQRVNAAGSTRQYVGFESMHYVLLNGNTKFAVGKSFATSDATYYDEVHVVAVQQELENCFVNIFPNPSNDGLFYLSTNITKLISISLMDFAGRKLWTRNSDHGDSNVIDLTSFPDGSYVVMIQSINKTYVKKVVKRTRYTN